MTAEVTATPYAALGGETGIKRLVHRFYALMDELPEACTVRQMHPESLEGGKVHTVEYAQNAAQLRSMLGLEPSQEAGTL